MNCQSHGLPNRGSGSILEGSRGIRGKVGNVAPVLVLKAVCLGSVVLPSAMMFQSSSASSWTENEPSRDGLHPVCKIKRDPVLGNGLIVTPSRCAGIARQGISNRALSNRSLSANSQLRLEVPEDLCHARRAGKLAFSCQRCLAFLCHDSPIQRHAHTHASEPPRMLGGTCPYPRPSK